MATPDFGTQLIGQTERALGAILAKLLADTTVTEPQWVVLQVTLAADGTLTTTELTGRLVTVLKLSAADAKTHLAELAAQGLVEVPDDAEAAVAVTVDGHELVRAVRAAIGDITGRLWGDLPQEDVAVAGRVLATVLTRANLEVANA